MDDRLRDTLYPAWRQADLSAPQALQELHAMRVVATPFGATAPAEDSLRTLQTLRVQVDYDEQVKPGRTLLSFTSAKDTWEHNLTDLTEEVTIDLGPGRFTFNPSGTRLSFTFTRQLPERKLEVHQENAEKKIKVQLEGLTGSGLDPVEHNLAVGDAPPGQAHGKGFVAWFRRTAADENDPQRVVFTLQTYALNPPTILALDGVYEGIGPGSWVVVTRPRKGQEIGGDEKLSTVTARVTTARTVAKQAFGISGKVTELTLDRPWLDEYDTLLSHLRDATVHARGDRLELAEEPVPEPVAGNVIELAEL
ncbi:hypothetical protein N8J89_33990 [Crossiella sp. CA-258035]|uniref:hypothetical protein n=1 Tax=Crossiella sp. CA-258035 TaxID=2981138 RepID=UPI0024BC457C|nr:hypothetical protein [Crossiella sp. CA-258035]WHT18081.1 hypothetical protein N8J89_33990 [Crossiella sp. CA-258035]